jgi:hypothetical protein
VHGGSSGCTLGQPLMLEPPTTFAEIAGGTATDRQAPVRRLRMRSRLSRCP